MINVERTFTVRKDRDVVLQYLQDFSHAEEWDPGTISCKRIDEGPIHVGSQWHNVSRFRGKETELSYQLTHLGFGRLTFVGENKTATSVDDLTLTSVSSGTAITYHATITFKGLAKLATPFLKREFEKLGDEVVTTMTETLEAL